MELRLVDAAMHVDATTSPPELHLRLKHGARFSRRLDGNRFVVRAEVELAGASGPDADTIPPVVTISATFELVYALSGELTPTEEVLEEFARVNGVYNAWPYWREFIQNAASRMNLPPLVLPVFRVQKPTERQTELPAERHAKGTIRRTRRASAPRPER